MKIDDLLAIKKTLYVSRKVINVDDISKWASSQGLEVSSLDKLHVTLVFSKAAVDWKKFEQDDSEMEIEVETKLELFGEDKNILVIQFESDELAKRNKEFLDGGCSTDFDEYKPHVTIQYDLDASFDLENIKPYKGLLLLGPEEFTEVDLEWKENNIDSE